MRLGYSDDSTKLFAGLPTLNVATINTSNRSQVPVSPLFAKPSGAQTNVVSGVGQVQTNTSGTSSVNTQGTATIPFVTTTSGTLPPKQQV